MNKIKTKFKLMIAKADAKHIVILSMGVIGAQIISILTQPVITRLYSPEAFGNLSLLISLANIFLPLSTMQYHISIVNAKKEEEFALCKLTFFLVILTTVVFAMGLVVYVQIGGEKYEKLGSLIYISVIWYSMMGIVYIIESYNNRHNEYNLMTKVTFNRAVFSNITKIGLGLLNTGIIGLTIGQTVGYIAGLKKQAQSFVGHIIQIKHTEWSQVWQVAKKYSAQPLYALPGLFILQISYSALSIIINTAYSAEDSGFFALSMTILGIPLALVSNNVARVFFKNASQEYEEKENFRSTFRNTAALLILLSVMGFGILWLIAEPVFALVYGKAWIKSGTYVKLLIPMYAMRFVVTGMMHGFVISNQQRLKTILQGLFIVALIIGYFLAKYSILSIEEFLRFINWSYFGLYMLLFIVLWKQSGKLK